ncbi:MAG: DUF488 family protein [Actinomycetota bacterium]|jgi:uncharacterized protein YeaO (DUF488 family)|nr:DUF488 family protein [Actinomycetota bacterium]
MEARPDPGVTVVRVYDHVPRPPGAYRVLVDRLWPRGVTRDAADIDAWSTDCAPSSDLRRWYGHVPERFGEFARRYRAELATGEAAAAVGELRARAGAGPLVLVTATRDVARSGAEVLRAVIAGEV